MNYKIPEMKVIASVADAFCFCLVFGFGDTD